jgi:hypothetical protein
LGEGFYIVLRLRKHEVGIEKQLAVSTQINDSLGAESQIRYKITIHDIEMDPTQPGFGYDTDTFLEICMVTG